VNAVRRSSGTGDLLPLAVDVECYPPYGLVAPELVVRRLGDFLGRLYELTGRRAMIYTASWTWNLMTGDSTGFADHRLWIACWVRCPVPPLIGGWTDWTLWQDGPIHIAGVPQLDGNLARTADLASLVRHGLRLAGGAATTRQPRVTVSLDGFDGTEVRVAIDAAPFGDWQPYAPSIEADLGRPGRHVVRVQLRDDSLGTSRVFAASIVLRRSGPSAGQP